MKPLVTYAAPVLAVLVALASLPMLAQAAVDAALSVEANQAFVAANAKKRASSPWPMACNIACCRTARAGIPA